MEDDDEDSSGGSDDSDEDEDSSGSDSDEDSSEDEREIVFRNYKPRNKELAKKKRNVMKFIKEGL